MPDRVKRRNTPEVGYCALHPICLHCTCNIPCRPGARDGARAGDGVEYDEEVQVGALDIRLVRGLNSIIAFDACNLACDLTGRMRVGGRHDGEIRTLGRGPHDGGGRGTAPGGAADDDEPSEHQPYLDQSLPRGPGGLWRSISRHRRTVPPRRSATSQSTRIARCDRRAVLRICVRTALQHHSRRRACSALSRSSVFRSAVCVPGHAGLALYVDLLDLCL